MFDFEKSVKLALCTWYPKSHNLHFNHHHPLGKLCGEWGELLDDYMKSNYKPDYQFKPLMELGDIWYYIRILCYQKNHRPTEVRIDNGQNSPTDLVIAYAIHEAIHAFIDFFEQGIYRISALDTSWTALSIICNRYNITLQELTESNWQKLKPGSKRGNEWIKARES